MLINRFFELQDGKFAVDDDVLPDGTIVKRGEVVVYVQYAMGRMELLWGPDASQFRPERWLKDNVYQPESPFKFSAFQVPEPSNFILEQGICSFQVIFGYSMYSMYVSGLIS